MDDNQFWNDEISSDDKKEDFKSVILRCKSLQSVREAIYEFDKNSDQTPFQKDTEYYIQIIDILLENSSNNKRIDEQLTSKFPPTIEDHIEELYKNLQDLETDDDLIIG
jgi:hypothetical protein